MQKQRSDWHHRIVVKRQNNLKSKYKDVLAKIIRYRELKNKAYLHKPKQMHQLIMALIGRMLSYVQLWERDIYFVLLCFVFLKHSTLEARDTDKNFYKLVNKGQSITAVNNDYLYKEKPFERSADIQGICNELRHVFRINANVELRNNLAHINYLRISNNEAVTLPNFTDLINHLRKMLAYDRKLKNAVAKSMIELLERHNLIISFTVNQHQLKLKSLDSKTIFHFGKQKKREDNIPEKLHSSDFAKLVKKIFN